MRLTRQLLRQWGACWTDTEIAAQVPEDGVTPLQVCDAAAVSIDDRLWVLLREDVIPERDLRLLVCKWAAEALRAAKVDDLRCWRAVWVAAQYAHGLATIEQLAAARAAAWDAASAAARDAARAAARAAASAAASAAARDAARDAAWAAARSAHLSDVRRVLVGLGEA